MSDQSKLNKVDSAGGNQHLSMNNAANPVSFSPPAFQLKSSPADGGEEEALEPVQEKSVEDSNFEAAENPDSGAGTGAGADAGAEGADGADDNGGLPTQLKAGVESLSGQDMSDVSVHRNSSEPAQFNAHAYAQGADIHLGPGQEKHLPHEAWHVAQQKQGRVEPTTQMKSAPVNDDPGLEKEADDMGAKAAQFKADTDSQYLSPGQKGGPAQFMLPQPPTGSPLQLKYNDAVSQFAGTDINIMGDGAKDLAFSYMGSLWEEIKANFDLEGFLLQAVKDLLDIVGLNVLEGATKAISDQAAKLAGAVSQVTNVVNILIKIKEWIDRVPKPVKEFFKYLIGHLMHRIGKWLMDEGLDDSVINKVVFGAEDVYAAFGSAIETLQAAIDKINGWISKGIDKVTSSRWWQEASSVLGSSWDYLKEKFGDDIGSAIDSVGGAVGDLWGSTKKLATPGEENDDPMEVDLSFIWLRVNSAEVQKWNETDENGEQKEKGGLVVDSQVGIRLSGQEIAADIGLKIDYGADYRFKLGMPQPMLEGGIGVDGWFNLAGLQLEDMEMSSKEGLEKLIVSLSRVAFGPDVLVGENLRFEYFKNGELPFKLDGEAALNAFGKTLNGNLMLGFKGGGELGKAKFHVGTGDQEFEIIKNHLMIKNINADGEWTDGQFDHLMIAGDPEIGVPGVHVTGDQVGLEYLQEEGWRGKADQLLIEFLIGGSTVSIQLNNAGVDETGFVADDVTIRFSGAGQEDAEKADESGDEGQKAGLVKEFLPGFEMDWLTSIVDVQEIEMHVANARIGWGAGEKEGEGAESGDSSEKEESENAGIETVSDTSKETSTETENEEGEEKNNIFTLRRLKATVFGITVDGSYNDEEEKFEGTIASKFFGQDSGRKPAEFDVETREGGAWAAEVRDLALLPESRSLFEIMDVGPIVLNKITFDSNDGITALDLVVDEFAIGGDILAAKGLTFNYTKDSGILETDTTVYLKLLQDNPKLAGKLNMKFGQDGKLISGTAIKEKGEEQFNLLENHILLANPSFYAHWTGEEGLKELMAAGDIELKIPQAKVNATNASFHFDKAEKIFKGHVDELSGKVRLGEQTLVMILIENAGIDKKGLSAESIKLTFSYGDDEAPMDDLESVSKGDLGTLIPGFNPSVLGDVAGIDTFVMDLTTTNVSYDFNDDESDDQIKESEEQDEKKSETSLAIRKLKAHAFGFELDGKYEDKVFQGSLQHEDFGGGDFSIDHSNPEQWVARAADVDLNFGGRKLFNVFGIDSVQLHEFEYASGQGMRILNLSVNKLDFGNGIFMTEKITGVLKDDLLQFKGMGVQLDLFGYKLDGAFDVTIDKEGNPQLIKASLDGQTDLTVIENILKLTNMGGSVEWTKGALKSMNVHAGVDLTPYPGIDMDATDLAMNYSQEKGFTGNLKEASVGIRISDQLQMLFKLEDSELSKGGDGVNFTSKRAAASIAYNKEIIEPDADLSQSQLPSLLPNLPLEWLDFAGLKALVFTAEANDISIGPEGLKVGQWNKIVEHLEGAWAGLEVGYNAGNPELGFGEEMGDKVENKLDEWSGGNEEQSGESGGGSGEESEKSQGDPSTDRFDPLSELNGPGGYLRGKWGKEVRTPKIAIDFPILPGLSVGGGIDAGLSVEAGVAAGLQKLPDLQDGQEQFKAAGGAGAKATGDLKIDLHATLGHQLIVAIQAGLFAKAAISAGAEGTVSGLILWDREANRMSLGKNAKDKPRVDLSFKTNLSASVGAEIKAKAFIFFEKTLWSYEFKKWDLGEWLLEGHLQAKEDGGYEWIHKASGFGEDGGKPKTKPDADIEEVVASEVIESGEPIKDKRLAWRLYHDVMDPDNGYNAEEQTSLLKKLQDITKTGDITEQLGEEEDLRTMMDEMRRRTGDEDHSLIMTPGEWDAYSTTDAGAWIFKHETARKSVKAVDQKVEAYHQAKTTEEKIQVIKGSLSDSEIAEELPKLNLRKPHKKQSLFDRSGLIDICDLFLLKESDSSRRSMVAAMRGDAEKELDRLEEEGSRRRN